MNVHIGNTVKGREDFVSVPLNNVKWTTNIDVKLYTIMLGNTTLRNSCQNSIHFIFYRYLLLSIELLIYILCPVRIII